MKGLILPTQCPDFL